METGSAEYFCSSAKQRESMIKGSSGDCLKCSSDTFENSENKDAVIGMRPLRYIEI